MLADLCIVLAPTEAAAQERAAQLDALVAPGSAVPRYVGTPAGLVELFARWSAEGACDGFNLLPAVLPDDVDLLTDAAIPLAQERGLVRRSYGGTTLREHLRAAPAGKPICGELRLSMPQMHLGLFIYPAGHHIASWRHPSGGCACHRRDGLLPNSGASSLNRASSICSS